MITGLLTFLAIPLGEATVAYLALDLVFRHVPLEPRRLRTELSRYRRTYATVGGLAVLAGACLQWIALLGTLRPGADAVFTPGAHDLPTTLILVSGLTAVAVMCDILPWWLLWRFGMRKQFTFLYTLDDPRSE